MRHRSRAAAIVLGVAAACLAVIRPWQLRRGARRGEIGAQLGRGRGRFHSELRPVPPAVRHAGH